MNEKNTSYVAKLKKQKNQSCWMLPYAYSGRRSAVRISLVEDKKSPNFGRYLVYCGAAAKIADTLEEAAKAAIEFTHGGFLT